MRSSFRKDDPGYATRVTGKVTVNGVEVHKCHTADEEQGVAHCYATNANGAVVREGNRIKEITHYGKVVITPNTNQHGR